jgi:hypothetical protein
MNSIENKTQSAVRKDEDCFKSGSSIVSEYQERESKKKLKR